MGRFDADNGLIHFTFANEDRYFKDSLVCLNLAQNLYYELKEKGYKTVYYISIVGNKYRLSFGDTSAFELYDKYEDRGFFSIFKKGSTDDEVVNYKEFELTQKQEFLRRLIKTMKNKDNKAAYVFTIEAFATFGGFEQELKEVEKNNYSYNNLILIKAPVEAEGSLHYFTDPGSIYRSDLFPDIQSIFENHQNVYFYDRLKKDMPGQVSYMNTLDLKEIENLLQYTILDLDSKIDSRLPFVDDYAVCLWYLNHSLQFREWVKEECCSYLDQQFPFNQKRKLSVIEEAMRKDSSYRVLEKISVHIRSLAGYSTEKLERILPMISEKLHIQDCKEENQEYIFLNNRLWQQIQILDYDFINTKEKKDYVRKKLANIRNALLTPCVNVDEERHSEVEGYIKEYINVAGNASVMSDRQSFQYAIDALHYAVCKCEEEKSLYQEGTYSDEKEKVENSCLDSYKYMLVYQREIHEYRNQIKEIKQSTEEMMERFHKIKKYVDAMKNNVPDLPKKAEEYRNSEAYRKSVSMKLASFIEDYNMKSREGNDLYNAIKRKKQAVKVAEEQLMQAQKCVNEMDASISGLTISKGSGLRKKVTDMVEDITIIFDNVSRDLQEGQKDIKPGGFQIPVYAGFEERWMESLEDVSFDDDFYAGLDISENE